MQPHGSMALARPLATVLVLAAVAVSGCGSKGNATISIGGGPASSGAIVGNGQGVVELTPQEKAKLLTDIQKDPNRLKTLTLPEKRYIRTIAAAKDIKRQDKAAGR